MALGCLRRRASLVKQKHGERQAQAGEQTRGIQLLRGVSASSNSRRVTAANGLSCKQSCTEVICV